MREMKDPNNNNKTNRTNMTFSNDIILTNQFIMDDNPLNPLNPLNPNPFAEYMWMENEEEFNRQVEEELWEEDFMERCFQEMLEEEEMLEWFIPSRDLPSSSSSSQTVSALQEQISLMVLDQETLVVNSNLDPNAEEFTPAIQKHMV